MIPLVFPKNREAVEAMCKDPARHWQLWVASILSLLLVIGVVAAIATG